MLDITISNDTCIKAIFNKLYLNFIKKKQRFCYIDHIINIVIQAFIYRKDE